MKEEKFKEDKSKGIQIDLTGKVALNDVRVEELKKFKRGICSLKNKFFNKPFRWQE